MIKLSIIVPYYDLSVGREAFVRCLKSLVAQKRPDVEILIYHDGELNIKVHDDIQFLLDELGISIIETDKRMNVWGHNLRDLGIKECKGEYVLHLNSDNVLYNLNSIINVLNTNDEVYLFPILMRGLLRHNSGEAIRTNNIYDVTGLTGNPVLGKIDAMQIITKKNVWLNIGGWNDYTINSDGKLIEKIVKNYSYTKTRVIIGEHW